MNRANAGAIRGKLIVIPIGTKERIVNIGGDITRIFYGYIGLKCVVCAFTVSPTITAISATAGSRCAMGLCMQPAEACGDLVFLGSTR